MRIPRKNSDTLIVMGGKSGAFWLGFYATLGVIVAGLFVLGVSRWVRLAMGWLSQWWGA
jgi:hypothetical protein